MGSRIAKSMVANEFVDWIELSNDYSIVEIAVPRRWEGKVLQSWMCVRSTGSR